MFTHFPGAPLWHGRFLQWLDWHCLQPCIQTGAPVAERAIERRSPFVDHFVIDVPDCISQTSPSNWKGHVMLPAISCTILPSSPPTNGWMHSGDEPLAREIANGIVHTGRSGFIGSPCFGPSRWTTVIESKRDLSIKPEGCRMPPTTCIACSTGLYFFELQSVPAHLPATPTIHAT